jgi:hypothetical protein
MPVDMLLAISHGCGMREYRQSRRENLKPNKDENSNNAVASIDKTLQHSCLEIFRLP